MIHYFEIKCSKGTYIRSLAHDFGLKLNNAAYLSKLRRIQIGTYKLEDAWDLNDLIDYIQNEVKTSEQNE